MEYKPGISEYVVELQSINKRVLAHSYEEKCIRKPHCRFLDIGHSAVDYFCIQMVCKGFNQPTFYWGLQKDCIKLKAYIA